MSPKPFTHCARVILITTLFWSIGGRTAPLEIPDFPLFLTSAGVPPNLVITLDDSGSMRRGWVPESVTSISEIINGPRFKSPSFNAIYYNPRLNYSLPMRSDGTTYTTSFINAYFNGFDPSKGVVGNLGTNYRVVGQSETTHSYSDCSGLLTTTNSPGTCRFVRNPDGTTTPTGAYYYLYYQDRSGQSRPASCTPDNRNNDNCYVRIIVSATSGMDRDGDGTISAIEADERQNFANWYSFYRTRAMAVMSGAMTSISNLENERVRLGWQTINACKTFGTTCRGYDDINRENRLRVLDSTHKSNFFNWLERLTISGNTPLRSALNRAGQYFMLSGLNSPYAQNPYVTLGTEYSCRKNFHVLFTDGLWNSETFTFPGTNTNPDSTGTTTLGDSITLSDGTIISSYSPRSPYKDMGSIYPKSYTNTRSLADLAFYYWAKDLRDTLDNNVSPNMVDFSGTPTEQFWNSRNNPATWQHMVNFTIGLGLSTSLVSKCHYQTGTSLIDDPNNPNPGCPVWAGSTYSGDYNLLVSGHRNWPRINTSPTLNEEPDGHVYDLWHAAINSRGKFYSAENPSDLISAFEDIMNTITSAAASGGGARVSSNLARITEANPTAFLARFNADWSGTLEAFPFNADGSLGATPYWEAGSLIPPGNLEAPSASRKIFTRNGGSAQEFTISICNSSSPLTTALNQNASAVVDNLCSQRLAWLRGYTAITDASWNSSTNTVTFTVPNHGLKAGNSVVVTGITPVAYNGTYTVASVTTNSFTAPLATDPGTYVSDEIDTDRNNDDKVRYANFRDRLSVLGDIMNSGTVYAHKENFGYGGANIAVIGGKTAYTDYVTQKASRTPVVYVGANDGMLHAFNAEISGANMGRELFAYIPAGVYHNLSALTDPTYDRSHKYFVDATPTLGDAYIGDGWKTYLVGGLRAGGKSIYALDVSNPNSFSATNVKWEFNDSSISTPNTPGDDMGLTFGQPQIAAISEDRWAVIFGNGYNSASEDAVLFIVDLEDGSLIAGIPTNSGPSNGLSTPFPFDKDGDGIVDVIYAGDLQGNLWKFEKDDLGDWVLGNEGDPLFIARIDSNYPVQAITTQPNAILVDGKVMVYFGTGRYLEASDLINDEVQTFYAIEDKESSPGTVSRTNLLEQEIISSAVTAGSFTARTVTNNPTTDHPNNRGCYLDFPATPGQPSERIGAASLIKFFKTSGLDTRVIFTTATPTADPCEKSGTSWLMELSTTCGRLGGKSPFDVNQDQKFDDDDLVTIDGESGQTLSGLALKPTTGIVTEITWVEGDPLKGIAYKVLPGSTGQVEVIANSSDPILPGSPPKRISWEQIQ